jgi:hypothetical protein
MATQTQAQRKAAGQKAAATRKRRAADRSRAARRAAETRARAQASSLKAVGWQATRAADTAVGATLLAAESALEAVRPTAKGPRQRLTRARQRFSRGLRGVERRGATARQRTLRNARRRVGAAR